MHSVCGAKSVEGPLPTGTQGVGLDMVCLGSEPVGRRLRVPPRSSLMRW